MEVIIHKCPNCGGPLTFEPKDQKFHCPYCLSVFTADEVSAFEEKQKAAQVAAPEESSKEKSETGNEAAAAGEMALYQCPSCGAEIVTDATTAATYCYYCHNPVVLLGRLSGKFLPDKVLPFAIDKKDATARFLKWIRRKKFIPKAFFQKEQIEKLTGVYFPYWVVDADTEGTFQGLGNVLRVWVVGDLEYTETKQYDVLRSGKIHFRQLTKNALSKNIKQKMVARIQPFPLDKTIPFKDQYLSGFQAEKRDIEFEKIDEDVTQELGDYTKEMLHDAAPGYVVIVNQKSTTKIDELKKNYMLLPVWVLTYREKGSDQVYYYAMNGQTGKASGVLPISYPKLFFAAAGIFFGILIFGLLGGYFL